MCPSQHKLPASSFRCRRLIWLSCAVMALLLLGGGIWLLLSEPPVIVQIKQMPLNSTLTEGIPSMPVLQTPRASQGWINGVEV
ncbi:hypothetical protein AADS67_004702 [Escherichia coli]